MQFLIEVKKADIQHIEGIIKVCSDGYRATYINTHSLEYIERIISEFYNYDRVHKEVLHSNDGWNGYFIALEGEKVVGAIGGGLIDKDKGEVFVLYLDPNRRGEGIGTQLLQVLTELQKSKGATEQWVSVSKGNMKGIPFYEARGFQFETEQDSFDNNEDEDYISFRYRRKI
ncbi:GNAT family N-acetyltransferase [Metabacillus sp. 84]|uniref:GNAT family N-acetyltransferase n=1 Tax=Metabacillus sp. 84 TaxID=3404705 RepID=UPI003CE82FD0